MDTLILLRKIVFLIVVQIVFCKRILHAQDNIFVYHLTPMYEKVGCSLYISYTATVNNNII